MIMEVGARGMTNEFIDIQVLFLRKGKAGIEEINLIVEKKKILFFES